LRARALQTQRLFALPVSARRSAREAVSGADALCVRRTLDRRGFIEICRPLRLTASIFLRGRKRDVGYWHIASFRWAAIFGRYRNNSGQQSVLGATNKDAVAFLAHRELLRLETLRAIPKLAHQRNFRATGKSNEICNLLDYCRTDCSTALFGVQAFFHLEIMSRKVRTL
jgi:hypothetical protein